VIRGINQKCGGVASKALRFAVGTGHNPLVHLLTQLHVWTAGPVVGVFPGFFDFTWEYKVGAGNPVGLRFRGLGGGVEFRG